VFTLTCIVIYAQPEELFEDSRDGQKYRIVKIGETLWFQDNLMYETLLSKPLSDENKERHNLQSTKGRYYHFQELDSICPKGWRLPDWKDWNNYINYLLKDNDTLQLTMETVGEPHHHIIEGFSGVINLFEEGNPLDLHPVGRYQGQIVSTNPDTPFADYWTIDENEAINGTSHAHLWDVLNIHSHKHHMNPNNEKELRRFMVRCVC
jgi:uncharacterized protein (TIGR02145 family)